MQSKVVVNRAFFPVRSPDQPNHSEFPLSVSVIALHLANFIPCGHCALSEKTVKFNLAWYPVLCHNGPSEKLDFSMPFCSIFFTDSEYTTLFEMPSILSELQPIKVWLKYIGPKSVRRKSWIFLCHFVAFSSQIQNIQLFLKRHHY